jgi:WD40 repeat protein
VSVNVERIDRLIRTICRVQYFSFTRRRHDRVKCGNGKILLLGTSTVEVTLTGQSRPVTSVAWNNNGTKLATGSIDKTVKIWSVVSAGTFECQSSLNRYTREVTCNCVAFSPDNKLVTIGNLDGSVRLWDVQERSWTRCQLVCQSDGVRYLGFKSDGLLTRICQADSSFVMWVLNL